MHLADEVFDHLFGRVEVGDNAFPHRADCFDAARGAAQHQLGVLADGEHLFHAILDVIGDHGGFRQNNAPALDIDQRVGGAEVDRHI